MLLLPSAITTEATVTNEPESERGYDAIYRHLPPSDDFVNEVVLARAPGKDVTTDRDAQLEIERLASALSRPGGRRAFSRTSTRRIRACSRLDRDAAVITIGMGPDAEDGIKDVIDVVEQADRVPLEVTITGEFTADDDFLALSNKDLKEGELFFGLPAALVVLLLVFGAVVASLVPILLAIVAIVVALALVAIVGQVWEVSFFVVNMLTGMGLALGVDYSLFVVSRFREERARSVEKIEAITATGRTASRAVLFSGTAFVIALDWHAARPGHDPAQPRRRSNPRRPDGGRRRDDTAARDPSRCSAIASTRSASRSSAAVRARPRSGAPSSTACSAGRSCTWSSRRPSSSCSPCRRRAADGIGRRADAPGWLRVEGRLQRA